MSDLELPPQDDHPLGGTIRPLSVPMTDDMRNQLDILAQLNNRTVTKEARAALEHWIEKSKTDPDVLKRAEIARAQIEQEAAAKREAVESIFSGGRKDSGKPAARTPRKEAGEYPIPRFPSRASGRGDRGSS